MRLLVNTIVLPELRKACVAYLLSTHVFAVGAVIYADLGVAVTWMLVLLALVHGAICVRRDGLSAGPNAIVALELSDERVVAVQFADGRRAAVTGPPWHFGLGVGFVFGVPIALKATFNSSFWAPPGLHWQGCVVLGNAELSAEASYQLARAIHLSAPAPQAE